MDVSNYWPDRREIRPAPRCARPATTLAPPVLDVHGRQRSIIAYTMFLEILSDRKHEQHQDIVRWIGGVFDPKGFDLNRINRDFKGAKGRRR
jgi:Plasmid pRiA4b ORF-3-like protein